MLNVHGVTDVRQTEIHTAVPLVPEPTVFEVEMSIENIRRYISPGIDQILAEFIKVVSRAIRSEIRKHSNCIWIKEELHEKWKESIRRVIKRIVDIREEYLLPTT